MSYDRWVMVVVVVVVCCDADSVLLLLLLLLFGYDFVSCRVDVSLRLCFGDQKKPYPPDDRIESM